MYLFTTSSCKRTALLLFLLISLPLAACSGNSNGSGSIAQPPIKVGLLGPFSGPEGFIGQNSMKGVQLAADYINARQSRRRLFSRLFNRAKSPISFLGGQLSSTTS